MHDKPQMQSTHVEDEERVLGCHDFWWAVIRHLRRLLVPPLIPALRPRNLASRALQHQYMFNVGTLLQRSVHDCLRRDRLPSALALVRSEEDLALAVDHTITKRLGRETCEDDGMDGADAGASEEGGDGLPCHREVDRDGVSLLDAHGLEDIGDTADFTEELRVRDVAAFVGLVGFVNDGGLSQVDNMIMRKMGRRNGWG